MYALFLRKHILDFLLVGPLHGMFKPPFDAIVGLGLRTAVFVVTLGLSLAINRDGSSGGVIRLASINQEGVERFVLTGNQIPKFYEDY